jgi:hypothetical protein
MATKTPPAPTAKAQQPPDERFWVKYSRHHELPISGMASLVWHTLALVTIVVVAWVITSASRNDMPIELVDFGPGSGGTNGVGTSPNRGDGSPLTEAVAASQLPPDAKVPTEPLRDVPGLTIKLKDILAEVEANKDDEREITKGADHATQTLRRLADMDKKIRSALLSGIGNGTPGSGGGSGGGNQGGTGDQPGPGNRSTRAKRMVRWTITFNTQSGGDYLKQVHVLGAILAFNSPDGELRCVRDLMRRPVQADPVSRDELQKLNRLFWIDDRRDSVEQLARAMGLDYVPDRIYALFPHDFEQELLRKELAFKNKKEEEIIETRFQILMRGDKYTVVVTDQRHY